MKMEHRILAPKAGEVLAVNFAAGDRVDMGATLVELGD
jgi:biotin carboxyl carrier protein